MKKTLGYLVLTTMECQLSPWWNTFLQKYRSNSNLILKLSWNLTYYRRRHSPFLMLCWGRLGRHATWFDVKSFVLFGFHRPNTNLPSFSKLGMGSFDSNLCTSWFTYFFLSLIIVQVMLSYQAGTDVEMSLLVGEYVVVRKVLNTFGAWIKTNFWYDCRGYVMCPCY